jgi:transcriptional regulator with XRE-family HTH domain
MNADQCRAARALLVLGQKEACKRAGVNERALTRFETQGARLSSKTLNKLRAFFIVNGIIFVENAEGIGARTVSATAGIVPIFSTRERA